jgi:hypothetical protein
MPSLDAPVTATPCVTMPWTPSLPLTSAPRRKRAHSSAQLFWSVLLTTDVGYVSLEVSPPTAASLASASLFSDASGDPFAIRMM